ncbi:MAG: DsbA family protein [Rickettsiales bacterium]|nr:DsbA family protein [Rickettsiales bacterium]
MTFTKKNFRHKPSLVKPIAAIAAVLLIAGGSYYFFSKKSADPKNAEQEINSSGLDKNQKVKTVGDVEEVMAKWIEANPKAIIMSLQNMQRKAQEDQMKDAGKNIGAKKDELFNDKNSPQFAPSGYDVTVVEFFDYSCGYCKKANATVNELLKQDKKVRIVFKEFPILGVASFEMSSVAIAVNMASPSSYVKFHDALMKSQEKGKAAALKAAKSAGANVAKVEEILKNDKSKIESIIQANLALGGAIGINGTPGFVIGEELIPGAFELAAFKEKIAAVRAAK